MRTIRLLVSGLGTFLLFQFVSLYLSWPKQAILGGISLLIAIMISKARKTHLLTLALMLLSMAATLRYGWWRIHMVIDYFTNESNHRLSIDSFVMLILLSAEAYTFVIMVLGYMQTSAMLQRKPVPLPEDVESWPHVDVLIPTYNEPLSLVRYTALAAMNIDYPFDKLHVYILDDGTREDYRVFCEEAGIGYITREKHNHAKAGNINHALTKMHSPLVAIFDCDHVPTRSFLQFTVGWFLVEKKLAMLQTPHFFYSPDPFERNLQKFKSVPNEGELFYGIIQDGNDFWNATFFCGSCAVLRREALDAVGGIATETVTEDAHTSLRMQKRGWNTAYINMPQAAGLATETLSAHVGQRVRWARGMIQIMRTDNPLLARGMKFTQRLCYFNAMLHFMYAVPRLVFLLSPLAYMLFGLTIIPGYWVAILAYALPHLFISSLTNSRIQGQHRHSFWNEIYETVLAPYILLPTLLALINPKLGKFNVTDKGTTLSETRFDRKIAAPTTWLLLLNLIGVLATPYRIFVLDPAHPGVILSNLAWILFNMVILGVAAAVAHEQKQRRSAVRIPARLPVEIQLPDNTMLSGMTNDMSVGGASISLENHRASLPIGATVRIAFPHQTETESITAVIRGASAGQTRVQFRGIDLAEQETLTRALYSRADSWTYARTAHVEEDRPLVSLARVILLSFTGFKQSFLSLLPEKKPSTKIEESVAALLLAASILLLPHALHAQTAPKPEILVPDTAATTTTAVQTHITLKDMGIINSADMRGTHAYYGAHFLLSHTLLPRKASLKVSYRFDPTLDQHTATLTVRLNNNQIAILTPPEHGPRGGYNVTEIPISSDLLIRDNDLTFELNTNRTMANSTLSKTAILANIGATSVIDIESDPIPFRNDLGRLPLPIFDAGLQTPTTVPFVFLSQPDNKTLQAAGIVASWLGILTSSQPVRYSATVGAIPTGNAVVFSNRPSDLPQVLQPTSNSGSISIKANPSDPNGSVLVLAGKGSDQLLTVAQVLSMFKNNGDNAPLRGDTQVVNAFTMPDPRLPDDAPRWLPTDQQVSLLNYTTQPRLQSDGSQPLPLYIRVAPDLYYGETQNIPLHMHYQYNAKPLADGSALRLFINGMLVNEAPLLPGEATTQKKREVLLPVANMRPFANTLQFNFDFIPNNLAKGTLPSSHLSGEILKDSSLDLRGLDHWAEMPNLELFSNAGFPFTRIADLKDTVVVLPEHPSSAEMSLYLQLIGYFGSQTGYPALRLQVASPNEAIRDGSDYLVLGTIKNQAAFRSLAESLPVRFDGNELRSNGIMNSFERLQQTLITIAHQTSVNEEIKDQKIPPALIEGMESPYELGRSMVVVALRDDSAEEAFTSAFLERSQSSDISHSVSILAGKRFTSFSVPTAIYHIGTISRYSIMRIWLTKYFWLLTILVAATSLLLARWLDGYLQARGRKRLQYNVN